MADEKIIFPIGHDDGMRIADALEAMVTRGRGSTVTSLDGTALHAGVTVVEVVGVPTYVSDVAEYEEWGLTEPGWYVFARVTPRDGVLVTAETAITGAAGHVAEVGADHIDVAVRFGVAAQAQPVTIDWGAYAETIVFAPTDLAVRNLDYRVTFYVYDLEPFATWEYALATDATFVGTEYWVREGDSYARAAVKAGQAIPAGEYFTHSYALTEDETFQDGVTYYTKDGTTYTAAEVTVGGAVTADTYYVDKWTEAHGTFVGTLYWLPDEGGQEYSQAAVMAGEAVPADTYYKHSSVTFKNMVRNVTYRCDLPIDCPVTVVLPVIPDDGHGAWYDMQFYLPAANSLTLQLLDPDAQVATNGFASFGGNNVNTVTLHYVATAGKKVWRATNIASNIPAA